jgi:uncharacterized membrane protein YtjA (UPF0391 family)
MLGWAIAFVTAAVAVEYLGLIETAPMVTALTKVLFWVFVIGFLVSLGMHYKSTRGEGRPL